MSSDGSLPEIVCWMGQPAAGNPTQFILERAFAAAGLEWRCLTLEVGPDQLGDAVRGVRSMGFRGSSIGSPHRIAVLPHLDGLNENAERIGAANCLYRDGDRLVGDNSDGSAFVQALREVLDPAGKRAVVLGAGGTGRAIAIELARSAVASLTIVSRTAEHGQSLAESLASRFNISASFVLWEGDYPVAEGTEILVNATRVGLADAAARVPVRSDSLRPGMLVADTVVNPPQSRFLQEAAHAGCQTMHGLGMFVQQTAMCFRIWTGRDPDLTVLREALEEYLEF